MKTEGFLEAPESGRGWWYANGKEMVVNVSQFWPQD